MNDNEVEKLYISVEFLNLRDIKKIFKKSRSTISRWREIDPHGQSLYYNRPFPKPINPNEYSPLYSFIEVNNWYKNKRIKDKNH